MVKGLIPKKEGNCVEIDEYLAHQIQKGTKTFFDLKVELQNNEYVLVQKDALKVKENKVNNISVVENKFLYEIKNNSKDSCIRFKLDKKLKRNQKNINIYKQKEKQEINILFKKFSLVVFRYSPDNSDLSEKATACTTKSNSPHSDLISSNSFITSFFFSTSQLKVIFEFNFSAKGITLFFKASPKYVKANSAPASASF